MLRLPRQRSLGKVVYESERSNRSENLPEFEEISRSATGPLTAFARGVGQDRSRQKKRPSDRTRKLTRKKRPTRPQSQPEIKHMAYNLFGRAPGEVSLRLKRKVAAWGGDFLASLIALKFFTPIHQSRFRALMAAASSF